MSITRPSRRLAPATTKSERLPHSLRLLLAIAGKDKHSIGMSEAFSRAGLSGRLGSSAARLLEQAGWVGAYRRRLELTELGAEAAEELRTMRNR